MAKYELSNQQVNALLAFLNRVSLQGSEAESLVVVKQALRRPLKEEEAKKPVK